GHGLRQGWGGGFEWVVVDDRGRFRKLNNIFYRFWEFTKEEGGNYKGILYEPFMFQWVAGEETIFWFDTSLPNRTVAYIVCPPWQRAPRSHWRAFFDGDFEHVYEIIVNLVRFVDPSETNMGRFGSYVQDIREAHPSPRVGRTDGKAWFNFR